MASMQQIEMQNVPLCHLLLNKHYSVLAPAPGNLSPQNPGIWDMGYGLYPLRNVNLFTFIIVSLQT